MAKYVYYASEYMPLDSNVYTGGSTNVTSQMFYLADNSHYSIFPMLPQNNKGIGDFTSDTLFLAVHFIFCNYTVLLRLLF